MPECEFHEGDAEYKGVDHEHEVVADTTFAATVGDLAQEDTMTERCTRGSIMCRGGMIDLSERSAWVLTGSAGRQQARRVTDATLLKHLGSNDITIIDAPLDAQVDASFFSADILPVDVRRRVTSAARSMGVDHLDRPLGPDELVARSKLVTKTLNRITHASGGGDERRREIVERYGRELDHLMTTRGADDIAEAVASILSTNPKIAPAAVMRALGDVPSMNERLGVVEKSAAFTGSNRDVAPARPSPALAALGFTAGAVPAAFITADLSDPRSVSPHAALRFLERVDGVVTPEVVEASRNVLRATYTRVGIDEARRRLTAVSAAVGLDADRLRHARGVIASLVSDALGDTLDSPGRPVIGGRPSHNPGAVADRVILAVNYEGRQLEMIVRAARVSVEAGQPPIVAVEVVTLWEPASVLASKQMWEDPSVQVENVEDWNRATEAVIFKSISA